MQGQELENRQELRGVEGGVLVGTERELVGVAGVARGPPGKARVCVVDTSFFHEKNRVFPFFTRVDTGDPPAI